MMIDVPGKCGVKEILTGTVKFSVHSESILILENSPLNNKAREIVLEVCIGNSIGLFAETERF